MAEHVMTFDDVLPLVLRLSPLEKIKLVERVASALERELLGSPLKAQLLAPPPEPKGWGAKLVEAIESGEIDTSEWVAMDIEDPVEWVKQLRQKERTERESRL
jgi:hypothetical protein